MLDPDVMFKVAMFPRFTNVDVPDAKGSRIGKKDSTLANNINLM
jgi:hypothetical protein